MKEEEKILDIQEDAEYILGVASKDLIPKKTLLQKAYSYKRFKLNYNRLKPTKDLILQKIYCYKRPNSTKNLLLQKT